MEEILHQLRERWFIPIIYKVFCYTSQVVVWDFFHQQYVSLLEHFPHDLHVVFLAIPLGSMDPSNTHPWKCKWTIFLERFFSGKTTLPETNSSPLKLMVSNRKLLFHGSISRCYVSFREGRDHRLVGGWTHQPIWKKICATSNWEAFPQHAKSI